MDIEHPGQIKIPGRDPTHQQIQGNFIPSEAVLDVIILAQIALKLAHQKPTRFWRSSFWFRSL